MTQKVDVRQTPCLYLHKWFELLPFAIKIKEFVSLNPLELRGIFHNDKQIIHVHVRWSLAN